jgi:hypothetical protein
MCDYLSEINKMRQSYSLSVIRPLRKPDWLRRTDKLNTLFSESEVLFRHGHIYYAALVQANEILFRNFPRNDAPASFVYSTDPFFDEYPEELCNVASQLFSYKFEETDNLPSEYRKIAAAIADEHDRTKFDFELDIGGIPRKLSFVTTIVFRRHLPGGRITAPIHPILADPDIADNVLILPCRYWTESFKKQYKSK